jgi:hypothetical protein
MYHFLATGPGRVDILAGRKDLMSGDTLSVESNEAHYVLNSYKDFLSLTSYDPDEPKVKDSLAHTLAQAAQLAADIAPTPTIKVGLDENQTNVDDEDPDQTQVPLVDDDLSPNAKAPEAASYIALLIDSNPVPLAKIKAIADRYPKHKQIQTLLTQAEAKVNLPS